MVQLNYVTCPLVYGMYGVVVKNSMPGYPQTRAKNLLTNCGLLTVK